MFGIFELEQKVKIIFPFMGNVHAITIMLNEVSHQRKGDHDIASQ